MRTEPLFFLAATLVTELVALSLLARTTPREQPSALSYAGLAILPLFAWFVSLLARGLAHPLWVIPFAVSWVLVALAWLVVDRRVRDENGLRFFPSGVRAFEERGVGGRCLDSLATRLAGVANALVVTITRDEVWVRPSRLLPAAALGLVHRIPLRRIHLMERLTGRHANVRLEYAGSDGWCRCVELRLRNPGVFIEAVREGQLEGLG